jgi:hypothetical protein
MGYRQILEEASQVIFLSFYHHSLTLSLSFHILE